MRKIQLVSKYIALSEEGLVPRLECPLDQGLLFSNLTLEDEVYLYCISCSYKKFIGSAFYDNISGILKKAGLYEEMS
ncbi:MAG: hypothetical protein EBZ58_11470 [Bacteroidetes bacterium]|jgi:hypothetical protein|nr:hypothetical protein [bacterium]NDC31528.1 hypothetical protein [Bacteroidota bacterium]